MTKVTASFTSSYVIHKDNFSETMAGVTFLLKILKEKRRDVAISRAILLMSHFMIENFFWKTASEWVNTQNVSELDRSRYKEDCKNRIGLKNAIDEWPTLLVGRSFDFANNKVFESMKCLINERNEIAHSERVSHYSYYIDTYFGASAAYFTSIESTKAIHCHFFGNQPYKYNELEKIYPSPEQVLFKDALSEAKKKSIEHIEKENLKDLKSIAEYSRLEKNIDFKKKAKEIFGDIFITRFENSINECEYPIFVTKHFIDKLKLIPDRQKTKIQQTLSPLLSTLTYEKMNGKYGVRFGEVLPHSKLNIKRILFENNRRYMCMPSGKNMIVFIIGTEDILLLDLV